MELPQDASHALARAVRPPGDPALWRAAHVAEVRRCAAFAAAAGAPTDCASYLGVIGRVRRGSSSSRTLR
jgi:hypothetical protein